MQLISLLMLSLSIVLLVGAVAFVALWHRTYRKTSLVQLLHEDIGHIGVSAIVAYPETSAPLIALLEEEYPHSEAVVVVDLQENVEAFETLIRRYRLMRVNHSHLEGVRALYRSRYRAFRRVVMVDLPSAYRERAVAIGREVASYENVLCLEGECIVERDTVAYCANVAASQSLSDRFSLCSVVGAEARFENGAIADSDSVVRLRADHPLAWRKGGVLWALLALLLPSAAMLLASLFQSRLIALAATFMLLAVVLLLYVSSRAKTEKSLFARLDTVVQNFCRFWARRARKQPLAPSVRAERESGYSTRVENSRSLSSPSAGARIK